MRLVKKILLLLIVLIMFSGCTIKNENSMNIDKEGKLTYEILIAFDREVLSNVINAVNLDEELVKITDDVMFDFIKNNDTMKMPYLDGLKKEEFKDDNFIGTKYFYSVEHIDDVSTSETIKVNMVDFRGDKKLSEQKLFTKNGFKYSANYDFNLKNNEKYNDLEYIVRFNLSLPTSPISHNASETFDGGKTLRWNITDNNHNVNFSFDLRGNKIYIILSMIAIIFVAISAFIVILNRNGGKR